MSCLNSEQGGNIRKDLFLAYKTLGVVFGGLVTSPLYVYPSMNLASPTKDDYMGLYSIMFWTLTLIGVVKYVGIALNADDHGEGNYRAVAAFLLLKLMATLEGDLVLKDLAVETLYLTLITFIFSVYRGLH